MFPAEVPPRAPGFSELPGRGQGRYSPVWALPGLLSLYLWDGDENDFLSPLLTWFLGGPQSHWWSSRWILEGVCDEKFSTSSYI